MKQKLITTILIWLVTQTMSMGQCQEDETIRTNPSNPTNTELPSSKARYINQHYQTVKPKKRLIFNPN
jgi:hypothetical protein